MALKIRFSKRGTNTEGAVTGELILFDGANAIRSAHAFSGGRGHNPIDDGVYRLRLDVRGDAKTNEANTKYLWELRSPPSVLDVTVEGGAGMNVELLVPKNVAKA